MACRCTLLHGFLAAMILVIAVFVVAPAVDAATCAPEAPSAHGTSAHDADTGDHSDPAAQHGLCAHGHCHHGGGALKLAEAEFQPSVPPARLRPRADHLALTPRPGGLERPPRA